MTMNNFYVYAHVHSDTQVFYIGKGKNRRATKSDGRNNMWRNIVKKYGYVTQIVQKNLSEVEAFKLEAELIQFYGRRDLGLGPLANLTDGGEGMSGYSHSSETLRKLSEAKKGNRIMLGKHRTEETKLKISESRKGMKFTEEHKEKIRAARIGKMMTDDARKKISEANSKAVLCINTGIIYKTLQEAIIETGVSYYLISRVCNSKIKSVKGLMFKFIDKQEITQEVKNEN